jgi:hypothetical protein
MDNNVEVTISHSSNTTGSKRPRSRSGSTGSCNGNQPPLSSNAAGSNDKTEDRTNNSATTNKAVSSNRIKCPSQGTHVVWNDECFILHDIALCAGSRQLILKSFFNLLGCMYTGYATDNETMSFNQFLK